MKAPLEKDSPERGRGAQEHADIATQPSLRSLRPVFLVLLCTVLGSAAQVFLKIGGSELHGFNPARILTDLPLFAGYALYGVNTLMLIAALREGELSKLYPIISLTFVWVNILSYFVFREQFNVFKLSGIAAIMVGVTLLGRSGAVE